MSDLQLEQVANIKVFGIDGGGYNAVNRMVSEGVKGVEFYAANIDFQALNISPVENKIVFGREMTKGPGVRTNPEMGRCAAQENESEIRGVTKGSDMVFIATGLGGETRTGATPMSARIAEEEGALTAGIVIKSFTFEGKRGMKSAEDGPAELKQYAGSLIIVSDNDLIEVINRRLLTEAFQAVDNVLRQGVQAITDLIAVPVLIGLDFTDVRTIMENQGSALIEIGMVEGEDKTRVVVEKAIQPPLLEVQITGASSAIVNITGGRSITLFNTEDVMAFVREAAGNDIDAIFSAVINEKLGNSVIVTVITTDSDKEGEEEEEIPVASAFTQPVSRPSTRVQTEGKPRCQELEEDDREGIPSFFSRR